MTKFQDMAYQRPDFEQEVSKALGLLDQLAKAKDEAAFFEALQAIDTQSRALSTQHTLCSIRHTIDTRDAFYAKENDVWDEVTPRLAEIQVQAARAVLESPYRDSVARRYGPHLLEKMEVSLKTITPEILPDLVEENKLVSEYERLIASAEIEFDGKKLNLSGLQPYIESTDREVRRQAYTAHWGWMAQRVDKLDELYDKLTAVRHRIGKKLGHENFIPVAYARMGRTDWDQQDAKVYRQQIVDSVVPLAQKLAREQLRRTGVTDPKIYDYALEFLSGNPKPQGEEDYLVAHAKKMYRELSPQTDEFFQMMVNQNLMDLTTKPGKASGGYMTFLPDYKVPYIFSNFNGTSGDVDVLTHEAGHAFQGWLQRDVELMAIAEYTSEVAEIHSMSMEFFTHPWMEGFFGPDTEKYFHAHVADAIRFLPYGASVDEFQEWVYEHPEATPDERRAQYRVIERKYLPHIEYEGFPYMEGGGRWQKQGHIYFAPFYYLDYTLAQVCALQYFTWSMKDRDAAWQSYLTLCKESGRLPFKQLVPKSGLKNPFEPGTIAQVTPALEQYMDSLDKSKIH
ncbi:MAG TPA: M3 family oligoendopeptidase [Clostridia bacterium]|nr:M3 family oligoendopeptidase [Clostridia bacterium]